jgi:Zn-finger nucleic acid-binding protein
MKCPACQETLSLSQRQGIEIDYCPTCRGVWLDRGELDKILEREAALAGPRPGPGGDYRRRDDDDDDHRYPRKRSLWRELFD